MAANRKINEDDTHFRSDAKRAVTEYWNNNKTLIKKYGLISQVGVYVISQFGCLGNYMLEMGVKKDFDHGYRFEYVYDFTNDKHTLTVFKKQKSVIS